MLLLSPPPKLERMRISQKGPWPSQKNSEPQASVEPKETAKDPEVPIDFEVGVLIEYGLLRILATRNLQFKCVNIPIQPQQSPGMLGDDQVNSEQVFPQKLENPISFECVGSGTRSQIFKHVTTLIV
jgi:hypothetical protein